jgi:hypothetical protein
MSFEVVAGSINRARNEKHLVWTEGMARWANAKTVPAFAKYMPGRPAGTRLEDLPSQSRARHRRGRPLVWPTIGFKLLYGLAIIHLARRHLVWTNATTNPTTEWIARQLTEAMLAELPACILRIVFALC